MQQRILIIDDDFAHRSMLKTLLRSWNYSVTDAQSGKEAMERLQEESFDLILSDVRMEGMDGLTLLEHILAFNPALPVLLMTAYSSVETAVRALRHGAYDYLIKPLDFGNLRETLQRAILQSKSTLDHKVLREQLSVMRQGESPILARTEVMQQLLETIEQVAPTEATVLITGESGTGKELVARQLHAKSLRSQKPLIVLNCAALAENLLESELFGHERGAFTGADKRRDGRFVQADGGTLFLDEIGEMPIACQAKLLRALQQGEIQRLGSDATISVDVRVIAATNRVLIEEVSKGNFRQDLYFRLNVISVEVPPLRERREDIPLLAGHFLEHFAKRNKKDVHGFAPTALDLLVRYSWPGNVRELENCVERAVILARESLIQEKDLPLSLQRNEQKPPSQANDLASLSLDDVERMAIEQTLQATNDNKSECARRLGITRATLHSKLKKYALG